MALDEEALNELYGWVDGIPLSRPKRNIARDFSDGVLVAEVVKFYFPKMVEMHNYAPASSTQQKLSNWGHLNRKVLSKLNFSVPEDVVRKIVQCTPGVVELVLLPLRQKIEEKQKQAKVSSNSYQVGGVAVGEAGTLDPTRQGGWKLLWGSDALPVPRRVKAAHGYPVPLQTDPSLRLHLAERDQALLTCQETVQILQMKVRRLEHLLQLKNVRIDELTRRLQRAEQKQK
uniref:Sperm flagellar protein 1 n=1 Tax=Varanus komodoensis TaxID=61221 RepID=A0A8D2LX74_VARKO